MFYCLDAKSSFPTYTYLFAFPNIGMLCGLDGEYLPDCYDGPDPVQSMAEFFAALIEAYGVPSLFGNQMGFDEEE
jgi:hypothetical protein